MGRVHSNQSASVTSDVYRKLSRIIVKSLSDLKWRATPLPTVNHKNYSMQTAREIKVNII